MSQLIPIRGAIQGYDWGSRSFLARFRGEGERSPGPEAELWLGTHARGPARLCGGVGDTSLAQLLASDPGRWLGSAAGPDEGLPFLLKVLAGEVPLSLQVHPDARQAREGYARESRSGLPEDDPARCYRDPRPKPELLYALEPFEALVGFRPLAEIVRCLRALGAGDLGLPVAELDGPDPEAAWRDCLRAILEAGTTLRERLLQRGEAYAAGREGDPAAAWVRTLCGLHRGDVACLAPLWLRHVRLRPGQALFLPPGLIHCYLHGAAIEVMVPSDNVLRAGLTAKPVHIEELLRVVSPSHAEPRCLEASALRPGEEGFDVGGEAFRLSLLRPGAAGSALDCACPGPELLLALDGGARVGRGAELCRLDRGQALFVAPGEEGYRVSGQGRVARVRAGGPAVGAA